MNPYRHFTVFAIGLLLSAAAFSEPQSTSPVNPAELVRKVRSQENWLHEFKTLYIYAERQWSSKADPNVLAEDKKSWHEFAIDQYRVRYYQNEPSYWLLEKVWNGQEFRCWEKYYNHPQNNYVLNNTFEEHSDFNELLSCNFGWPRSQSHSFWFDKPNTDLTEFYGRPENFTAGPVETCRGKQCYQLNYLVPNYNGLSFRWYVGIDDRLLYGLQVLRNDVISREHWFDDYQVVQTTGRFPRSLGWAFYKKNNHGKVELEGQCRVTVHLFRIDQPLDDKLFTLEFQPGINIQDHRGPQTREYTLAEPKKASASGKTASQVCEAVFADPAAKKIPMKTQTGGRDKFSGRPMEGTSMRVHEIELGFTPPLNVTKIEKSKVRYGRLQFQDFGKTFYHCALIGDQGDRFDQTFCIDLNCNGRWEENEYLKGFEPTKKTGMLKTWFGYVDVSLTNAAGDPYPHRVYVVYNHYDQLFVVSHSWKEGTVEIDGTQQHIYLVDHQCDGRFDSGYPVTEQQLFMGPAEADYDYIAWDENKNGRLDHQDRFYVGSRSVYRGKIYEIAATADGSQIAIRPVEVPTGQLALPVSECLLWLHGSRGPLIVWAEGGPLTIPADTYWVEYTRYNQNAAGQEPVWQTKSGRYYHQPWIIRPAATTTIARELLDATEDDKAEYEKKVLDHRRRTELARIQNVDKAYNSLLAETICDLSDLGLADDFKVKPDSPLLLCFWDYQQRPSRHEVSQLAAQKEMIGKKGIEVVLIHAAPMSEKAVQWIHGKQTAFHVGSLTKAADAIRKKWGVKSLPWLILTNTEHKVVAEGISVKSLEQRLH